MLENIDFRLNPPIDNPDLNELYRVSWPHHVDADHSPVLNRSLAHIWAYAEEELVGFVYLAWDGGVHSFLLDPTVRPDYRRQGLGLELVRRAATAAKDAGCEWLHVDYEEHLEPFYRAAGFRPTLAGLLQLTAV